MRKVAAFTGSRNGMTEEQSAGVERLLKELDVGTLLHGVAIGADEQTSLIAQRMDLKVKAYPADAGDDRSTTAFATEWKPPQAPLERNKVMVTNAHLLIATPDGPEKVPSGTWATVRFARDKKKLVHVVMPDGKVER
jgi:hypothetical protein